MRRDQPKRAGRHAIELKPAVRRCRDGEAMQEGRGVIGAFRLRGASLQELESLQQLHLGAVGVLSVCAVYPSTDDRWQDGGKIDDVVRHTFTEEAGR
jgi:hypothetical protein